MDAPQEINLSSALACSSRRIIINDLRSRDLEEIGNRSGVTAARAREVIDALLYYFNWDESVPCDDDWLA